MGSHGLLVLTVAGVLSSAGAVDAGEPQFWRIGFLASYPHSEAHDVSSDGLVVVGQSAAPSGAYEAFRWTAERGMTGLGFPTARAVNADGSVVVGTHLGFSGAYRWTAAAGTVDLSTIPGGDDLESLWDVSADGNVAVGWCSGGEACSWTPDAGTRRLGKPAGAWSESRAYGVSADGSVIVGSTWSAPTQRQEAFRWTAEDGMVGLGDLPGGDLYSVAFDVSRDGGVIVGHGQSEMSLEGQVNEVFRWTEADGMVGLGILLFDANRVCVSADGSTIAGGTTEHEAFVWDPLHGTRLLKDILADVAGEGIAGWRLHMATGVSADGETVVGYGTNPQGSWEAWIAVVPEPTSLLLLLAAAIPWWVLNRNLGLISILPGRSTGGDRGMGENRKE